MAATLDAPSFSNASIAAGATETISSTIRGDSTGASNVIVETIVTDPNGATVLDTANAFATVAANSATPFSVSLPITTNFAAGDYSVTQGIRSAPETITVNTPSGAPVGFPVQLSGTYSFVLTTFAAPSTFSVLAYMTDGQGNTMNDGGNPANPMVGP